MANVLFRGTKTFWKTKNSIEIVLLEHNDHYALEIAAFEPVLAIEAPRIYLNLLLVYPLLNLSHTSSKGSQEAMSAISTFVFNRLYISKYLPTSKVFEVVVRREFESIEQKGKFELMMDCPVNLIPYPSPFKTQ